MSQSPDEPKLEQTTVISTPRGSGSLAAYASRPKIPPGFEAAASELSRAWRAAFPAMAAVTAAIESERLVVPRPSFKPATFSSEYLGKWPDPIETIDLPTPAAIQRITGEPCDIDHLNRTVRAVQAGRITRDVALRRLLGKAGAFSYDARKTSRDDVVDAMAIGYMATREADRTRVIKKRMSPPESFTARMRRLRGSLDDS